MDLATLTNQMSMRRAEYEERLCAQAYPLGFDTIVRWSGAQDMGSTLMVFRIKNQPYRELRSAVDQLGSIRWMCVDARATWMGAAFDTASAAFVDANLQNWGRDGTLKVLNNWGLRLRDEWRSFGGCSCHLGGAPCSSCTHPGHPVAANEDPEQWEYV